MKHILLRKHETVYSIRPAEDASELSESETKIIESGFPGQWLVIYENAYGELKIDRLDSEQIKRKYGVALKG